MSSNVIILGMHRSGTSCLTGMLRECGLFLGDVDNCNPYNPKGNQEILTANNINDKLLELHGGTWYSPRKIKVIPEEIKAQILELKGELAQNGTWGIKDPRMVYCWPAWADTQTRYVGIFRHPLLVAYSLGSRNMAPFNYTLNQWLDVWYRYNKEIITLYHKAPFPMLNFDWEPERFRANVQNLGEWLALRCSGVEFYEQNLRTSLADVENITISPKYIQQYELLKEISEVEEKKLERQLTQRS